MAGKKRSERPFRIYDERANRDLPRRSYMTAARAIDKALVLLYWLELGNSYTIYDDRSSRAIIQFTRKVNGIQVMK